jgi:KDO2-lipid IV(A) lauroyltransferase
MLQRRQTLIQKLPDLALLTALRALAFALWPWPMRWRIGLGGAAGWLAGRLSKRRALALNNLKRVFSSDPSKTRRALFSILDDSYRDLGRTFIEFLMSPTLSSEYIESHIAVEGDDRLAQMVSEGKGVVLFTGHFGNWEFLNLMASTRGYRLAVLARLQKLHRTDAFLNGLREKRGARVVLRGMETRHLYRVLKAGGLAGILADQDGGTEGIHAPLFGRASSYPRGIARFTFVTGAPAVPVFSVRVAPDRHRIFIGSEIRLRPGEAEAIFEQRAVAEFSRQLEGMVLKYPTQWLWAHRRWKSSPERDVLVLDDGRKGHVNQSLALASRVADHRGNKSTTRVQTLSVEYRSSGTRALLTLYGILTRGRLWGGMRLARWALTDVSYRALSTAPADAVISCGSGTEAVNLIVAADCRARACYIHKPQFGRSRFAAVMAPGHDRLRQERKTVQLPGAVSFVNRQRLEELRAAARAKVGIEPEDRVLAFLVGGPSKMAPWDFKTLERAFFGLREILQELKLYLVATTSRRTDSATEAAFESSFVGAPLCAVALIANRENPAGAYEGILAAADCILVTADSVSMVSEAVSTGKPVGVIVAGDRAFMAPKFRRFLDEQIRMELVTEVTPDHLRNFLHSAWTQRAASDAGEDPLSRAAALLAL